MATSKSKQALRNYRRQNGLCIHCGDPAIEGLTRCQRCTNKDSENRKKYAKRDAALGICTNVGCSNETTNGKSHCDVCIGKCAKYKKLTYAKYVAAGLCGECGGETEDGRSRCPTCNERALARSKKHRNKRLAAGLTTSSTHSNLKLAVVNAYGGPVCVGCGECDIAILQIDHTDGGGCKHAKEIGGRAKMYAWLRKNNFPPGFRVLCPSCNMRAARGRPFPNAVPEPGLAEALLYL